MHKSQFEEITDWQKATFPNATTKSKILHLMQEVEELLNEVEPCEDGATGTYATKMEFADSFILLFGAAREFGMNYQQICDAIDKKMQINYQRKWGKPNANGVVNHVK